MMRIVWAEETKDDFRRFDEFLNPVNPDANRRAVQAIRDQVQILIDNPEAGKAINDGSGRRELLISFGKRGYILRYIPDYEARLIRIIRVWHGLEDRSGTID